MGMQIYTKSEVFAADVQALAITAEYSAIITKNPQLKSSNPKSLSILITEYRSDMYPLIYRREDENVRHYRGNVHCIEVPNHIFMVRRNRKYVWTGNSNRSGQKGICALLMRDSDMPCTKDGLRPSMIFNTHGIPSRMTIAQLMESVTSNLCVIKGITGNATFYNPCDTESVSAELENNNLDGMGRYKLYSGITGEYIDESIFMGVVYYQRLQKFVKDAIHNASHGPTDAITRQPLSGRSVSGGLKIGEMEKDVLMTHGATALLHEKFFSHSDGFNIYICRNCGQYAVVNHKRGIYKCHTCKDNADIAKVPSSYSSKLFTQELMSMNVGVRLGLTPYEYEEYEFDDVGDDKTNMTDDD